MAENKTQPAKQNPKEFIKTVEDEQKRKDSLLLLDLMKKITGEKPIMWGPSIIGYGKYHYKYDSGREGDFLKVGFSPRKQNLTVYIMPGFKKYETLLKKLGPHKSSVSCLYIKRLSDIDLKILEQAILYTQSMLIQVELMR